jgi:hypothetical protein
MDSVPCTSTGLTTVQSNHGTIVRGSTGFTANIMYSKSRKMNDDSRTQLPLVLHSTGDSGSPFCGTCHRTPNSPPHSVSIPIAAIAHVSMASESTSASSPTGSVSSADAALFEILGIDKLTLDREDECHEYDDQGDFHDTNSPRNAKAVVPPSVFTRIPPQHCHRPHTPHTPLLLESSPLLLSAAQCSYIIYNLGYRTTNNNDGPTIGPTYVTAAQHDGVIVPLLHPNHHKVCVFQSDLVLQWIQTAFQQSGIHHAIQEWCQTNGILNTDDTTNDTTDDTDDTDDDTSTDIIYRINPRLRLLRYDAINHDIFLPHYDATTTTTKTTSAGHCYESKLTILLYLNTGNGINFHGGNTLFLNSFQPSDCIEIVPKLGTFVVFNHELYHASQALTVHDNIECQDGIRGGTKFVLRTDVMFPVVDTVGTVSPQQHQLQHPEDYASVLALPVTTTTSDRPVTVQDVVHTLRETRTRTRTPTSHDLECDRLLLEILQQLDMDQLPVATFLVPGPVAVQAMLVDLGIDTTTAHEFVQHCQIHGLALL